MDLVTVKYCYARSESLPWALMKFDWDAKNSVIGVWPATPLVVNKSRK